MKTARLYPSPFKPGDRFEFTNQHGSVTLVAVAAPQAVNTIYIKNVPRECLLTFDEVEQVALITDQVRLQPVIHLETRGKASAFVRHATTDTAGWVKVVKLSYVSRVPASEQIEADLRGGRNRAF